MTLTMTLTLTTGETELRRLGCHQRGYRTAAASARGDECGGAAALCSAAHEIPHGAPDPSAQEPRLVRAFATLGIKSILRTFIQGGAAGVAYNDVDVWWEISYTIYTLEVRSKALTTVLSLYIEPAPEKERGPKAPRHLPRRADRLRSLPGTRTHVN